ncbi:hypothetical protein EVAR_27626_1 [Eumeta japonica]|uniref:Uncharacterized protein n=1 Tax=Eumeta variegata TaxID=151549 RepID=A0A4C1V1P0_EUMVA|nr:hypothetical protein EVAR_27626_1 [Eumeta japonica]
MKQHRLTNENNDACASEKSQFFVCTNVRDVLHSRAPPAVYHRELLSAYRKKERKRHFSIRKQLKRRLYGRGREILRYADTGARGKGSRFWDTRKASRFLNHEGRGWA